MDAYAKAMSDAAYYIACGNSLFSAAKYSPYARRAMKRWYRKADAARANAIGFASR